MERERKSLYIIFYFCILLFRFAQLFMHEFHTFLIKVMEEKKTGGREKQTIEHEIKFYNKRKRPIGFLWERLDFPLSYNDDVVWGLVVLMVRPEEKRKKIFFVFFFFTRKIPVETSF